MTARELASVTGGVRHATKLAGAAVAGGLAGWGVGWGIAKVRDWVRDTPPQRCFVAPQGGPLAGFPLCVIR